MTEDDTILKFLENPDNIKKLLQSKIKPKVVEYIRRDKLSEDVIDKLWSVENFRWPILRKQKLSEQRINNLIDSVANRSIKKPLDIALGLVKYQTLKDYQFNKLTQPNLSKNIILEVWYTRPKEAAKNGDFSHFLHVISDEDQLSKRGKNKFIKTINQVSRKTDKIKDILDIVLSYQSESSIVTVVNALIKDNYIDDEYVNKISSKIDKENFKNIAKVLIHKNNCSISMKAKLMLLK